MDIVLGGSPAVQEDPPKKHFPIPAGKKVIRRERRKNKQDRRRSVREGIFISFTGRNDRRVLRDRRKGN